MTTPITPGGNPASRASSARRTEEAGACGGGLRITVLPAASAGASFQEPRESAPLNGVSAATTPSGSRVISALAVSLSGRETSSMVSATPAK